MGVLSIIALLLAAIGIYGVMAYSVGQRTREIGVRMALGARREDILSLVVRGGAVMVTVGVLVGVAAAYAMGRLTASILYGVTAADPLSFGLACFTLAGAATLACYFPARRAAGVDAIVSLRAE